MWRWSLPLLIVAMPALAGGPKPTKVSWKFENIVDGFDHVQRIVIEADGMEVATSDPANESVKGSMSVMLPQDAESLRIVSLALYEGNWEEHTIDNEYAVDCLWEVDLYGRSPKKIDLVCDIDAGATFRVR